MFCWCNASFNAILLLLLFYIYILLLCYSRFPEDHAQQCVGANLSEEEDGLWQLFLTLPLLLLARQRRVPPPHRQENGRTGTCPGNPGPGPLKSIRTHTVKRHKCSCINTHTVHAHWFWAVTVVFLSQNIISDIFFEVYKFEIEIHILCSCLKSPN